MDGLAAAVGNVDVSVWRWVLGGALVGEVGGDRRAAAPEQDD